MFNSIPWRIRPEWLHSCLPLKIVTPTGKSPSSGRNTQTVSPDVEHTLVSLLLDTNKRFPEKTDSCAACRPSLYHFQEGFALSSQLALSNTFLFTLSRRDVQQSQYSSHHLSCLWWTQLLYINTKMKKYFQTKFWVYFFLHWDVIFYHVLSWSLDSITLHLSYNTCQT